MKSGYKIVCIESSSTYSTILKDHLEKCSIKHQQVPLLSDADCYSSPHKFVLYFMSFQSAVTEQKQIEQITEVSKDAFTVVYDAPITLSTSNLIRLGRLRGYLCAGISELSFLTDLKEVLSGQRILPINISYALIEYYQSLILRFSEPYSTNLTQREIQVLEFLRIGLTNNKLADELFVSEHTVKSHLYKIFKKISVSNRTQAIAWAHKYLP